MGTSNKSSEEKIDFHTHRDHNYIGDDFKDRELIIIDDMIKTGETLCCLADWLKKQGGEKVLAFIYHDLSQPIAKLNVTNSNINEVVLLNTANSDSTWCEKIVKLSTSKVLSKYIGELL